MISEALIGCRVEHIDKDDKGIIIGSSISSNGTIFIAVMRSDRTFTDMSLNNAILNEEDYKKIFKKLEPIKDRFEIMDL